MLVALSIHEYFLVFSIRHLTKEYQMTNEVILKIKRKLDGKILPNCKDSKRLIELTGKKTFSENDINVLAEYFFIEEEHWVVKNGMVAND
tara:strand:- start:258 stop:527 length:270 start_codon:yes stop_codon:yes gene_type:complete